MLLPLCGKAETYRYFTSNGELSSSLINHLYCDRNGMIWVATENGLNRYNGSRFETYYHEPGNPRSLLHNYVTSLCEDKEGHLFVMSHSGIQLYNPQTDDFSGPGRYADGSIFVEQVNRLVQRPDGNLYCAGNVFGKVSLENGMVVVDTTGLPHDFNYSDYIRSDQNGTLWMARYGVGVCCYTGSGHARRYSLGDHLNPTDLFVDSHNDVFAATTDGSLFRLDRVSDAFVPVRESRWHGNPVRCMFQPDEDRVFVGTDGSGIKVWHLNDDSFSDFVFGDEYMGSGRLKVHNIIRDGFGNLWISAYQKGLIMLPKLYNNFRYLGPNLQATNKIGNCSVTALCRDHKGVMWIGTDNGGIYAIRPEGGEPRHYAANKGPGSIPAAVLAMFEDSMGGIWIGSYADGAGRLDRNTGSYSRLSSFDTETTDVRHVPAFAEDGQKHLWIGTMGSGLFRYDLSSGRIMNFNSLIPDLPLYISSLHCSRDGRLYLGCYDGAMCLNLSDGSLECVLSSGIIHTIYEGEGGDIWFGCEEGFKILAPRTGEVKAVGMIDGLPGNSVFGIRRDRDGRMWLSTERGLSCYNPMAGSFMNFHAGDGIQGDEFSKNTSWEDADGTLWFGGNSGLTYFLPEQIESPYRGWHVRITDMYLHEKPVHKGMKSGRFQIVDRPIYEASDIYLSHRDNAFTILFSTLEYNAPERLEFVYTINGKKPVTLGGSRRVSFSSLIPGNYVFSIRAKDGNILSEPATLSFHIARPWWLSWWAELLYLLAALGIFLVIQYNHRRNKQMKEKMDEYRREEQAKEDKLRLFSSLSHELRTPLSLIINPLQRLMQTDGEEAHQKSYRIMYRNTERILQLTNQLMDMRKIDDGKMKLMFRETDLIPLINNVCDNFADQIQHKNISLAFSHPGLDSLALWIDPANFDKIMYNILSNACKFTPENGEIKIFLEKKGKDALLTVTDSGIGIPEGERDRIFERFYQSPEGQKVYRGGTGIGLHLTKSLVELHHGNIYAGNNVDLPGSHFILRLPLGNEHLRPEEMDRGGQEPLRESLPRHSVAMPGESPVTAPSKSKFKVLVVDDDEDIRNYVVEELSTDFHMLSASDGKEALKIIFDRKPDLVISDIIMPVMDGISLCNEIKQNITLNHIPVVLLTGKTDSSDNIAGLREGADAYITKPFNIDILRATAANMINSRKVLQVKFEGRQMREDKLEKLESSTPDDRLLARIMRALNANLSNTDMTIESLAAEVGISRVHLYRKLKELTNQSASEFIRNVRLTQAAKLFAGGKHSISEVAFLVGFKNPDHFSTAFGKLYGMTPTEYIRQQKNNNLSDK